MRAHAAAGFVLVAFAAVKADPDAVVLDGPVPRMVHAGQAGPMGYHFGTGPGWRLEERRLAEPPGLNVGDLTGLVVGAGPARGHFEMAIDEVVVR